MEPPPVVITIHWLSSSRLLNTNHKTLACSKVYIYLYLVFKIFILSGYYCGVSAFIWSHCDICWLNGKVTFLLSTTTFFVSSLLKYGYCFYTFFTQMDIYPHKTNSVSLKFPLFIQTSFRIIFLKTFFVCICNNVRATLAKKTHKLSLCSHLINTLHVSKP